MATTVTFKLNRAANEFQAGESVGFGISGGVKHYDHKTKQDEWTNYKAVIFSRQQGQIEFYRNALVEGAIVAVSGLNERIDSYEGQNGVILSIELLDAKIGFVSGGQSNNQSKPSQPAYQASANAQAPDDFDDQDLPF